MINLCNCRMKGINFRFMLIHVANGGNRDLPQRIYPLGYSRARHIMRYYYALPRCAAKSSVVAYTSELCVHEWCPQAYAHVRVSTCPPFEATLTLFQLPRKSRLREISTPPPGRTRPALP